MLLKNTKTNLLRMDTFDNYMKLTKLNNHGFLKLENWNNYVSKSDINYFMDWKKQNLLKELFNNPNFIHEFSKTHGYELLQIKNVRYKHSTVPYLDNSLSNNSPTTKLLTNV